MSRVHLIQDDLIFIVLYHEDSISKEGRIYRCQISSSACLSRRMHFYSLPSTASSEVLPGASCCAYPHLTLHLNTSTPQAYCDLYILLLLEEVSVWEVSAPLFSWHALRHAVFSFHTSCGSRVLTQAKEHLRMPEARRNPGLRASTPR